MVMPSAAISVPPSNWRRAMTTLSAAWMRMTGSVFMGLATAVDQLVMPPSAIITLPVVKAASSLAR